MQGIGRSSGWHLRVLFVLMELLGLGLHQASGLVLASSVVLQDTQGLSKVQVLSELGFSFWVCPYYLGFRFWGL